MNQGENTFEDLSSFDRDSQEHQNLNTTPFQLVSLEDLKSARVGALSFPMNEASDKISRVAHTCSYCKNVFDTRAKLRNHKKKAHKAPKNAQKEVGDLPLFTCSLCGHRCGYSNMRKHQRNKHMIESNNDTEFRESNITTQDERMEGSIQTIEQYGEQTKFQPSFERMEGSIQTMEQYGEQTKLQPLFTSTLENETLMYGNNISFMTGSVNPPTSVIILQTSTKERKTIHPWKYSLVKGKLKSSQRMLRQVRKQQQKQKQLPSTIKEACQSMLQISQHLQKTQQKMPFFMTMINVQLENSLKSDARLIRWPIPLLHYGLSLQYLGGQRCVEILRGRPIKPHSKKSNVSISENPINLLSSTTNVKQCSFQIDTNSTNLFFPSNSSLRGVLPPITGYEDLEKSFLLSMKACILRNPEFPKTGGIICDEMEIKQGIVFLRYCGLLVGTINPIKEKDVSQLENIQDKLASKVLQFFFISTDGTTTWPLGFVASHGATAELVFEKYRTIIEALKTLNIVVDWGSTDGFSGGMSFQKKMKVIYPDYLHIYDPLHILKLLRNTLLKTYIKSEQCPSGFSMKHMELFWRSSSELQARLSKQDLYPDDIMCVKNVTTLISTWEHIPLETNEGRGLSEYLHMCHNFYICFMENSMITQTLTSEQVKKKLDDCSKYFSKIQSNFSDQLTHHIETTVENTHILRLRNPKLVYLSHLGTNVVEVFFSIQRSKFYHPTLLQYAQMYQRAWMEFVKKNAIDLPFTYPSQETSQYYFNTSRVQTSVQDIELTTPRKKNIYYAEQRKANRSSDKKQQVEDHKLCLKWCNAFRCSKKRLTIRESTCKVPSFQSQDKEWYCPVFNCMQKPYKSKGSFMNHMKKKHDWSEDKIKNIPEQLFKDPSVNLSPSGGDVLDYEASIDIESIRHISSLQSSTSLGTTLQATSTPLPFLSLLSQAQQRLLYSTTIIEKDKTNPAMDDCLKYFENFI